MPDRRRKTVSREQSTANTALILIVEDTLPSALLLENQLRDLGYVNILITSSAEEALHHLEKQEPDLIISDLMMPGINGQELLTAVRERGYDMPFIIFTGHSSVESAVQAIKSGALDYLKKDCSVEDLAIVVQRALEFSRLTKDSKFREHVVQSHNFQSIITCSPAMTAALNAAERVAGSPRTTIAIFGESGVGKEVLARAIHFSGGGLPSNFVAVNCAAIPETLLESELFGHVKGAFTGADRDQEGKFALAKGGTLLLDEIGDMPMAIQAKLLRVCEERTYCKIGSNKQMPADFRIITATHRNLEQLVRQGKFREDLFHRLNVYPIVIPPLRERKEDIPLLVEHFLPFFRQHLGKPLPGISSKAMEALMAYSWPGNVRELRNCLERAAIVINDELIRPVHLVIHAPQQPVSGEGIDLHLTFKPEEFSLDAIINKALDETLKRCGGNKSMAAKRLNINRKMFNNRNVQDNNNPEL